MFRNESLKDLPVSLLEAKAKELGLNISKLVQQYNREIYNEFLRDMEYEYKLGSIEMFIEDTVPSIIQENQTKKKIITMIENASRRSPPKKYSPRNKGVSPRGVVVSPKNRVFPQKRNPRF
jgi:hypothetical protein